MAIIVLDAGHGGKDAGAVTNGLQEKDLTLKIVKMIAEGLKQYEGIKVYLTRNSDVFIELSKRAQIANTVKADSFISVHINAGGGTGFESYIYNKTQNKKTIELQNCLHAEIMRQIGNVKDRGKKRANYAVLRETAMPAVLTENLFMTNLKDCIYLNSEDGFNTIVDIHVEAIQKIIKLV